MKALLKLFILLAVGILPTFSASSSVSPQDPAFLDGFNDQQKSSIHIYLSQELGKAIPERNADVNASELKEFYTQHIDTWKGKIRSPLLNEPTNKKKSRTGIFKKKNAFDFNIFAKELFDECQSKVNSSNSINIHTDKIGSKGFTITKPGHYRITTKGGILKWKPSQIANLITIDADNVILDFNHTTIIQKPNSCFASTAINILSGHKNITIRNGSLVGFTADAIIAASTSDLFIENMLISDNNNRSIYAPSLIFASVNIQSCLNAVLRNVTVYNTSLNSTENIISAGILLLNTNTFLLTNCRVVGAKLDATTLAQGLGISTILSHNGVIEDCEVSNCLSNGIMPAFGYVFSQNILTRDCIANYNIGTQTTSGYYPQFSDSLQFINCEANNNQSTCQDCHGFPYFISTNGFFSNCRALNNMAVNPSGKFNEKVTGFEILVCVNCLIENCEAFNNTTTNPIRHYAAGFTNGNSTNVIFKECISIGNTGMGNSSRGVGFGPALDPRFFAPSIGTIWENCIAEGNFGDTLSIGFDLFGQIDGTLTGSISQNNGRNAINGIGILSDGFYDEGNPVDVPCNVVPIVVITNNDEQNVLVKDNTVSNNSFVGIYDSTSANNVYMNNIVFNNGINFVGGIFFEGTPIRNWTVSSPPNDANNNGVVGDKLDNLNVTTP